MITIFTTPKPFKGHFGIIQENAVKSWIKIKPKPEIILFGDEKGSGQIARKYSLAHIKKVQKNDTGTPLLSDIFQKAQAFSKNPVLAYVNADIILTNDFTEAVKNISLATFLMTGRRRNLKITRRINFEINWEKELRLKLAREGKLDQVGALDYFIFPKTINFRMPHFAVGRGVWDNWLIYKAKLLKIPVIDATKTITAIHQNHDYSHAGGYKAVWYGAERRQNLRLAAEKRRPFNLMNADWILTNDGVSRPLFSTFRLWRNLQVYPVTSPLIGFWLWPAVLFIEFIIKVYRKITNQV